MKVQLKVLDNRLIKNPEWGLPNYATGGSAAVDLRAIIDRNEYIYPGMTRLVPTGIAIHIAQPDIAAIIIPRSGIGHKNGIILGNGTGLIDSDYQGEIYVSLWNRGEEPFLIKPGDRIAQMYFINVLKVGFWQVEEFQGTERGEGGFGHSGIK